MPTFCDTRSIFHKMFLFCDQWWGNAISEMKSWNLYSALYCIQSQIWDVRSPLCQSTSICNVRTRARQRYSDISAIKRDIIHNGQSIMGPVSYSKPSTRVIAYLNEHCSQPQLWLCPAQMFRFPISSPSLRGMLFFPRVGDLTISKSTNWGEKWSIKWWFCLLRETLLTLLREVSYVLCKVGW